MNDNGASQARHAGDPLCWSVFALAVASLPMPISAMPCANMALVLAIDASGSISDTEYTFQLEATGRALRNPQVVSAMAATGGVAVAAVIWADTAFGVHPVPWVHVTDAGSADRLAQAIASQPRMVTGMTEMGPGILAALDLLDDPANCASYQVVDVSGDGRETRMSQQTDTTLQQARDRADAAGVVINGLAITRSDVHLVDYYRDHVIRGPGAFVIEARTFEDFEQAMIQKLLREVGGYGAALTADASEGADRSPFIDEIRVPRVLLLSEGS